MSNSTSYLKGLNTIRFFAASFVLLSHGYQSLLKINVLEPREYAAFYRGGESVELFFTLSGFLITYLLIREIQATDNVDIKFFYFRRIIRIWPLYFLSLAGGLFLLGIVYPRLIGADYADFPIGKTVFLYLFFLPNLAASYYKVGVLFPLWSIGVEEQFYLFWAPALRALKKHLLRFILAFLLLSTAWYVYLNGFLAGHLDRQFFSFLRTMKFHNMAIGALFAHVLEFHFEWYKRSVFSRPAAQILLPALVLYHYLVGIPVIPAYALNIFFSFVYGCIFINVSSLERPVVNLEFRPLKYLGEISYGIYMYHMFVDYILRYSLPRLRLPLDSLSFSVLYMVLLMVLTIASAAFSYRFFERYFLDLRRLYGVRKKVLHSPTELQKLPL
jgi:peptidoglycan/LPS O-acetylase OafA/YrhL